MDKDFDTWNHFKKKLNDSQRVFYVHPREVWWCSLGLNIGTEIDGKNDNFERPVLVMNVYNKETFFVLPFTTKPKIDRFHARVILAYIAHDGSIVVKMVWLKLTQARVVNRKRFWRKVDIIPEDEFYEIKKRFRDFI